MLKTFLRPCQECEAQQAHKHLKVWGQMAHATFAQHGGCVATDCHMSALLEGVRAVQHVRVLMALDGTLLAQQDVSPHPPVSKFVGAACMQACARMLGPCGVYAPCRQQPGRNPQRHPPGGPAA